ncbi:MAG TPA: Ku protein [Candidatus Acidoferrales bacterium]|nr:Ku protein [Candidatus Acidoferrales bacterium]
MPASVWKGFISFGLVSVPVRLYAAARSTRIQLHQLHATDHTRLRQPLFCPTDERIVDRSEVVKGYEYEPGKYVLIEPEDLKKIQPASARAMEILSFADAADVDPIAFDASYYIVPEDEGRKAYALLVKTLEDTHRVGIAKVTMHQREYTVFMRPYRHGLALHTMYFANEIREAPGFGETDHMKLSPQEVKLAQQLVGTLSEEFDLKKYHDEYQERLKELIDARQKGEEIAAAPAPKRAAVIDIMSALKKSLAASEGKQPKARAASKPGPSRAAAAHRRTAHRKAS